MKIIDITKDIPRSNYSTDRNGYVPSAFVLHITADSNLNNVLNWFKNPSALVSAHYVIAKNGDVYICVNPLYRAFHCGRVKNPNAKVYFDFHKTNPNNHTIGIECISNGEILTDAQEKSLLEIILKDSVRFRIPRNRERIIGHNELDSVDRKFDPILSYSVDNIVTKLQGGVILLKNGDRGTDVKGLQEKLNQVGYNLVEDGIFGANTESVVQSLQKQNGLNADGVVGPETLKFINETLERMNPEKKISIEQLDQRTTAIELFMKTHFKNFPMSSD